MKDFPLSLSPTEPLVNVYRV